MKTWIELEARLRRPGRVFVDLPCGNDWHTVEVKKASFKTLVRSYTEDIEATRPHELEIEDDGEDLYIREATP